MFLFFRRLKKNFWDYSAEEVAAEKLPHNQAAGIAENSMFFGLAAAVVAPAFAQVPALQTAITAPQHTLHL